MRIIFHQLVNANKWISDFLFKYGNTSIGFQFYETKVPYVEASQEVFLEDRLVHQYSCNLGHAFMSAEGQAESYNEVQVNG